MELAAKPDAELWREVVKIAGAHGVKLPDKSPSHEELESLRAAVTGAKINVGDALRLLDAYRKREKI